VNERRAIDLEQSARACEHALWIALLEAQRVPWPDLVDQIGLLHGIARDRRRDLETGEGEPPT
jgi:hypothetical protein